LRSACLTHDNRVPEERQVERGGAFSADRWDRFDVFANRSFLIESHPMPHAVFEPAADLALFWEKFEPFKVVLPNRHILETRAAFLRRDRDSVIVSAIAFEFGPPQHFFVVCDRSGDRVTVRCGTHVPLARTDGVIAVVQEVARRYLTLGGEVRSTNLDLAVVLGEEEAPEDA